MTAADRPGRAVHPIEVESYAIMSSRVDLSRWPTGAREVVARMIHATADESFADSALVGDRAVPAMVAALRSGAPVVCDARMVVAGISGARARCYLDRVGPAEGRATRSEAALELAASEHPEGALWVIGNAPTALRRLLRLHREGRLDPAGVVGLPVGYVDAAESKKALWDSPLRDLAVTNAGRRGGSPVAAAAVNALLRLAAATPDGAYEPPR